MTSRIILSQIKRVSALRAAIIPQINNNVAKRSLMTKSHIWSNRMKPQQFGSLLGSQQGKGNKYRFYSICSCFSLYPSPYNVHSN
jgi:hypothetical protein